MKFTRLAVVVFVFAIALFLFLPNLSWAADDAVHLFKSKCAACHGPEGKGETPIGKKENVPSFGSEAIKKKPVLELENMILNGGSAKKPGHAFAEKGISKVDAEALALHVKELGSK